jgi:hypothetical protein
MSDRKRIMLLEVSPLEVQPIVYATLDPASKGSGLTLSGGDLTAVSTTSTSNGRARSTVPLTSGEYYWETKLITVGTAGFVSSCGIMTADLDMTGGTLGYDGFKSAASPYLVSGLGYGYWNSTLVYAGASYPVNTVTRHWYNADTGVYKTAVNGGAFVTVFDRPASTSLLFYPAVTVARLMKFTINFGATAFVYAIPGNARGVYSQDAPEEVDLLLSSSKFSGLFKGTERPYEARISAKTDLVVSRYASCYAWTSKAQSSRGRLSLVAADGRIDAWRDYIWRDAPATILAGYEGDLRADFVVQSRELVDSVVFSDNFMDITFLDPLSALDTPLPREMYTATNANEVISNTAYPKVFGNPQYCEGPYRTTATTGIDAYAIDFTDANDVVEVLTAFDKGDVFDHLPSGGARDYWMTENGLGIKLQNAPAGKITAHPYGPFAYNAAGTNLITNANPFAGWSTPPTYNPPTGWTQTGTAWTVNNHFKNGTLASGASGSAHALTTGATASMYNSATSIAAGKYVIEFDVTVMTTTGYIGLTLGATTYFVKIDRVGKMRVAITNPGTNQLVISIGNAGSYVLGAINFVFSGFKCFAAAVPEYLPEWLALFAGTYGGRALNTAAIAALAAERNWRLAHFSNKDESLASIIQTTMDGWLGCVVPNRSGELTVFTLREPAATPDFSFDSSSIISVTSSEDKAPGLTTRIAGKRNHSPTQIEQIAGGATAAVRAELQREWLIVRTGQPTNNKLGGGFGTGLYTAANLVVRPQFRHADGSPPLPTFLQDANHIQIQANLVTTLFTEDRRVYPVDLVLESAISDLLECGMTINITWPRYDLVAGKNLILVGIQTGFWGNKVKLLLWG